MSDGTTLRLTLSAGPAPVPVPNVTGDSAANAQVALGAIRLHSTVSQVVGPRHEDGHGHASVAPPRTADRARLDRRPIGRRGAKLAAV